MRTARIETNLTCNQNCTYCDRRAAEDDPARVHERAIQDAIDQAIAAGARELVFTGGEPLLRADLEDLMTYAGRAGATAICLETNGTAITRERAENLARAGLGIARVNLSGAGADVDNITRDPGGRGRTLAGIKALIASGIRVEITAVVVSSTQSILPMLPQELSRLFGEGVASILVSVPITSPTPGELLSYDEASRVLSHLDREARQVGIPVRLRPDSGPPPCVPAAMGLNLPHLYALSAGGGARRGFEQLEGCAQCMVADRCPGISREYLAGRPLPPMEPITRERLRRRLSRAEDIDVQIRRELVAKSRRYMAGVGEINDEIVRVHFHCNEACRFCFVSTHLPPPAPHLVRDAIVQAGKRGARISLSGGEPALNPRLPEYIRLAKKVSIHPVELQTNAVPMADQALARSLAQAGLDEALVSLHGSTADLSDGITLVPGSFERTVAGIEHLRAEGITVVVNFVIHTTNQDELPAFVRFVGSRWPDMYVNVSFVHASSDIVPRQRDLVPRYGDVMPALLEAITQAQALGVRLTGLQSLCGLPLCLVPMEIRQGLTLRVLSNTEEDSEMQKLEECSGCAMENKCHGVRSSYVELYGSGELQRLSE